jgi:hypothetical protein
VPVPFGQPSPQCRAVGGVATESPSAARTQRRKPPEERLARDEAVERTAVPGIERADDRPHETNLRYRVAPGTAPTCAAATGRDGERETPATDSQEQAVPTVDHGAKSNGLFVVFPPRSNGKDPADVEMPDRDTQEQIAKNDATFREANERIAQTADRLAFEDEPVPFLCECADMECYEIARLTLDEYRHVRSDPRWFWNVPGHERAAQGAAEVLERHDGYLILEKTGHAGEVAEELSGEVELADER